MEWASRVGIVFSFITWKKSTGWGKNFKIVKRPCSLNRYTEYLVLVHNFNNFISYIWIILSFIWFTCIKWIFTKCKGLLNMIVGVKIPIIILSCKSVRIKFDLGFHCFRENCQKVLYSNKLSLINLVFSFFFLAGRAKKGLMHPMVVTSKSALTSC